MPARPKPRPTAPGANANTRKAFRDLGGVRADVALQGRAGAIDQVDQVRRVFANALITGGDYALDVVDVSASPVILLPDAALYPGRRFAVQDRSGNAAGGTPIVLTPVASQQVNGAASVNIETAYGRKVIRSTGSGWVTED